MVFKISSKFKHNKIIILILVVILFVSIIISEKNEQIVAYESIEDSNQGSFFTQGYLMEDLANTELNMSDALDVFRYVFHRLDHEVMIYQSENNLYLRFAAHGRIFGGIITLAIITRDEGIISLSYIERNENPNIAPRVDYMGGGGLFNQSDGVNVKKINDWKYNVTFENKSVIFDLYHAGMDPPKKEKLLAEEVYVGPVFDESGIEMYLIFNKKVNRLYLILNEDRYVREQFQDIGEDVLIGYRTSFAFFNDSKNDRKILIGVRGENTIQNNWYDGPHDQMPDNYIYYGFIPKYLEYLEAAYPGLKGKMDRYGHFLEKDTGRVAVAPYYVYFYEQDLLNISKACKKMDSPSKMYDCLTVQIYDIPEEKEYLMHKY
jgi:hypothetical protein